MNRIDETFGTLRSRGEKALIPYITAGDPDLKTTVALASKLAEAGADILELGIPYSDPLADGPTIQHASTRALAAGTRIDGILKATAAIRQASKIPLLYMVYYNSIFRYGVERFVNRAATAGIDGLIVPDLPPEEAGELRKAAEEAGLRIVFLLAPTSTGSRVRLVTAVAQGFLYCVSVTGVTGARGTVSTSVQDLVSQVRKISDIPVGIGFGISTPEQAAQVASYADAAIVGSAVIERVARAENPAAGVEDAAAFVASLKQAILNHQRVAGTRV